MNAKALSTYLGHATISITMDRYGHLMPCNEEEAAALLDAYVQRADTASRVAQLTASPETFSEPRRVSPARLASHRLHGLSELIHL